MSSQWDTTLARMFQTCWDRRGLLPNPSSCRDDQLFNLYDDMQYQWSVYDKIMRSDFPGKPVDEDGHIFHGLDAGEERIILGKLCYFEDMIENIENEIKRRPWLH